MTENKIEIIITIDDPDAILLWDTLKDSFDEAGFTEEEIARHFFLTELVNFYESVLEGE